MSLICSRSRSNCHETKDDIEPIEIFASLPYETSCYKSTYDYNVASTPTMDPANDTSENLLVQADHGLIILSQLPTFDTTWLESNAERKDLAVLIDQHHRAFQSPAPLSNPDWTWKKATIEVVTLRKAFPAIKEAEETLLAMTAWFHFLSNIDDEIERMESLGRALILKRIIEALKAASLDRSRLTEDTMPARGVMDTFKRAKIGLHHKIPLEMYVRRPNSRHTAACSNIAGQGRTIVNDLTEKGHMKVLALASNFIRQCQVVLSHETLIKVFAQVIDCLEALGEEPAYHENTTMLTVEDYLRLRMRTIGLSPFFTILETILVGIETQKIKACNSGNKHNIKDPCGDESTASNSNDSSSFWTSPLHRKLCDRIQRIAGLQNDILGLNRDIENGERLNLAVLLLEQRSQSTENLQAINKARATAVMMHNTEMQNMIRNWADIQAANQSTAVQVYAQSLVALTRTLYTWATHADRYQPKHTTISEGLSSVQLWRD